jgi:ribosomal protein S18 acetylase RimI-like enzyme
MEALPASAVIRAGTPAELPRFAESWLDMFEEVGIIHEREMVTDWRSRFQAYLHRRMAEGEAAFFVALENGAIVGTAGALIPEYPYAVHGIKRGYIFGVQVSPECRHRGIATRLTNAAIGFLRDVGCKKIRLHASPFGRPIYERLGFKPTNEMEL